MEVKPLYIYYRSKEEYENIMYSLTFLLAALGEELRITFLGISIFKFYITILYLV
jgi:hypothetical protein